MNSFTINDIENLCGIKAHTLRIWEKRYGLLTPKRKESNHRIYDNEDLRHILQVVYLYNKGHKISKIARYHEGDFKILTSVNERNAEAQLLFINGLLQAAFNFDEELFDETLSMAIERLGFEECIIKVVYPYFEKVGLLWMNNVAVPAQEHFSSNIIRNKLIVAIDKTRIPLSPPGTKILLFTPEHENHEIPLLLPIIYLRKTIKIFII